MMLAFYVGAAPVRRQILTGFQITKAHELMESNKTKGKIICVIE